jgi:hypothetical protein
MREGKKKAQEGFRHQTKRGVYLQEYLMVHDISTLDIG